MKPSVYPATKALYRWMNSELMAVEQATFSAFMMIRPLSRMVMEAERGERAEHAARRAIRRFNEDNGTHWTYEDIRTQCATYLWSDCGGWALYTDRPDLVISSQEDEIDQAIHAAPEDMQWAIYVASAEATAFVLRSPEGDYRSCLPEDTMFCNGLEGGESPAFVLPQNIESAIKQEIPTP